MIAFGPSKRAGFKCLGFRVLGFRLGVEGLGFMCFFLSSLSLFLSLYVLLLRGGWGFEGGGFQCP